MSTYVGEGRRLSITKITDIDGTVVDPTTLVFTMTEPDGVVTTYTYGTDAQLVRDSTGNFHVDWSIAKAGEHVYSFEGSGSATVIKEGSFIAEAVTGTILPAIAYTTPAALRAELGVTVETLDDTAAHRLIERAETLIDSLLGFRYTDDATGRKVLVADVDAWRASKLSTATAILAAKLYLKPDLLERWQSVRGPDFAVSGPASSLIGTEVLAYLNASGLRRLGGRARGDGIATRGWRGVLLDDGTWDDEPAWSDPATGGLG